MSIPVPTEILCEILDLLETDRKALQNLRLASKKLCEVTTRVLFRTLSIHYGFSHSVAQTQKIVSNPLIVSSVKSLFIPSESFFPGLHSCRLPDNCKCRWTREPLEGQPFHQMNSSDYYHGSRPSQRQRRENVPPPPIDKIIRKTNEQYLDAMAALLEACMNLREVHIAIGAGWLNKRIAIWVSFITGILFPIMAKVGVEKVEMSMPDLGLFRRFFENYNDKTVLRSFTFIAINIHSLGPGTTRKAKEEIQERVSPFFFNIPNLTAYKIGNERKAGTSELDRSLRLLPPFSTMAKLTFLELNSMRFTESVYEEFLTLVNAVPLLRKLALVVIEVLRNRVSGPFEYQDMPSNSFVDLPRINWTTIFSILLQRLPQLVEPVFKALLYSDFTDERGVWMVQPIVPVEWIEKPTSVRITLGQEFISPYQGDHLALAAFKAEISKRRERVGLCQLVEKEGEHSTGVKRYPLWGFL
ncbi:hypothetical protein TWF730_010338 [Orbilia blumenaviensis]|uniref:F-box domain-containing protein n=1 Tax=Orbilia blumenaviensis TaxID=1796055 RepID=A0AAV9URQ7_9PEZI